MCGIFCLLKKNTSENINEIDRDLFYKSKHRGPDASRLLTSTTSNHNNVLTLGFHRLAIVDDSENGMAPFFLNGMFCIANGEIYNYKYLKAMYLSDYVFQSDCDTEVILYLFDHFKKDVVKLCEHLSGEFSFIIVDDEKIHIGTDELSTRPLFFGSNDESLFLSSELTSLPQNLKILQRLPAGFVAKFSRRSGCLSDLFSYFSFELPKTIYEISSGRLRN